MGFLTGLVQNIPDNYQQSTNEPVIPIKKEFPTPTEGKRKRTM